MAEYRETLDLDRIYEAMCSWKKYSASSILDFVYCTITLLFVQGKQREARLLLDNVSSIGHLYPRFWSKYPYPKKLFGTRSDMFIHLLQGEQLLNEGKYNEAIEQFGKVKETKSKVGDRVTEAQVSEGLAKAYHSLGKFKDALEHVEKCFSIFREEGDPHGEGVSLQLAGNIYNDLGQSDTALILLINALDIAIKLEDKHFEETIFTCLGNTCNQLKKHTAALFFCQKALDICSNEVINSLDAAKNMINMASAYSHLGEFQKAIKLCEKSLPIFQQFGNNEGIEVCYGNLGIAHRGLKNHENALHFHKRCVEMNEKLYHDVDKAISYYNLGVVYLDQAVYSTIMASLRGASPEDNKSHLENSEKYLKQSLDTADKLFFDLGADTHRVSFHDRFYRCHVSLMSVFLMGKRTAAAFLVLDLGKAKALQLLTETRHDARNVSREKTWSAIEDEREKERIIDLCEVLKLKNPDCTVLVYAFDRTDMLILLIMDSDGNVKRAIWEPDNRTVSSYDGLLVHLSPLLSRVSVSVDREYSFFLSDSPEKLIASTEDDASSVFDEMENVHLRQPEPSVIDTVRPERKSDSSTNSQNEKPRLMSAVPSERIELKKSQERSPNLAHDSTALNDEEFRLHALYEALIGPVKDFIVGTKLIIVPDSTLFFVPFSSLLDDSGRYLSADYQIQIAPSLHALATSMKLQDNSNVGHALFVGNPAVGNVSFRGSSKKLERLPFATEEARHLAALFGANALVEDSATKERVLEEMQDACIVHIAAHGLKDNGSVFLAPSSVDQHGSGLPTERSYLLTQADVLRCRVVARLVVLSCCHSGRGRTSSEGVLGLARAFLGAGARSVLITLWAINDSATKHFMDQFYRKISDGTAVCEALKLTMNSFQAHNFYKSLKFWAPFEIFGEDVSFSKKDLEEIRAKSAVRV